MKRLSNIEEARCLKVSSVHLRKQIVLKSLITFVFHIKIWNSVYFEINVMYMFILVQSFALSATGRRTDRQTDRQTN